MSRLRPAEWAVLGGALGLLVTMFFDWYEGPAGWPEDLNTTGWTSLGWFTIVLLVVCIACGLLLCGLLAADVGDAYNLPPGVILATLGLPTLLVLLVVVLLQPGLGPGLPNAVVKLQPAGWVGLLCAVLLVVGGLLSIHDERTTGAGRHYTPPPERPASPA